MIRISPLFSRWDVLKAIVFVLLVFVALFQYCGTPPHFHFGSAHIRRSLRTLSHVMICNWTARWWRMAIRATGTPPGGAHSFPKPHNAYGATTVHDDGLGGPQMVIRQLRRENNLMNPCVAKSNTSRAANWQHFTVGLQADTSPPSPWLCFNELTSGWLTIA